MNISFKHIWYIYIYIDLYIGKMVSVFGREKERVNMAYKIL